MSAPFELKIIWDEIEVRIAHHPKRFHNDFDHLEIRVEEGQILPITKTGYKSHFLPGSVVQQYGGAEAFVRAWLDHAAQSADWIKRKEAAKQYSLF